MLSRLGWATVHHRRLVLEIGVAFIVLAAVLGAGVLNSLTAGGFVDPRSESELARRQLLAEFDAGPPNVALLVTAEHGTVDSPDVRVEAAELTRRASEQRGVDQVWSYWSAGSPPSLRSDDGRSGLILVRLGGDEDQAQKALPALLDELDTDHAGVTVGVTGTAEVSRQAQEQIRADLERAEVLSMPVLMLLLVLVFGSAVAAGLPLLLGGVSVVGTLLVLRVLSSVTDVSMFALNLTTALGLGLAIDYSLFVVARYREESGRGLPHEDAIVRSVETAGRTVLFSAATVAISMSALLLFPTVFLRSFAYAGIAVVALSAGAAIVVLPALLAVLVPWLDRWALRRSESRGRHRRSLPLLWHRIAEATMRRPVILGASVLALLILLGLPALQVTPGLPDHRVLPESATSRLTQERIDAHFGRGEGNGIVVVTAPGSPAPTDGDLARYAAGLSTLSGVARVDAATGIYVAGQLVGTAGDGAQFRSPGATWLNLVPSVEPVSPAAEELVAQVRSEPAPTEMLVGGPSAQLVDTKDGLFDRLPLALGLIGLVTFTILFLFTGGVLVAVKGILMNVLTLTATLGVMVWAFQEGHLSGLLSFTATGTLDTNMPILLFCVVFGLSMDYEVFLLSRIKEHYDLTGDNRAAVAAGLGSTGRLVSAAALILAVVFLAFATSGISFIKLLGVGTALAVLLDATLVRGVLMPSLMRLAGDANWWAPAPLRSLHRRFGLAETPLTPDAAEPRRHEGTEPLGEGQPAALAG